MDGIKYEDLSVIWTRENGPDWAEIDETVIEAITKEVEEGCIS